MSGLNSRDTVIVASLKRWTTIRAGDLKRLAITEEEFGRLAPPCLVRCNACNIAIPNDSELVGSYNPYNNNCDALCLGCSPVLQGAESAILTAPLSVFKAVTGELAHFREVSRGAIYLRTLLNNSLHAYARPAATPWGRKTRSECVAILIEELSELLATDNGRDERAELLDILGVILIALLKSGTKPDAYVSVASWVSKQAQRGRMPLIDGAVLGQLLDRIHKSYYHPAAADALSTSMEPQWRMLRQKFGWKRCDRCDRAGRALYINSDSPSRSYCAECAVEQGATAVALAKATVFVIN